MIRIIRLHGEPNEMLRSTVAATRTRDTDIAYVQRLMRQKADQYLLPGWRTVPDSTIVGGYFADSMGDCIIAEHVNA